MSKKTKPQQVVSAKPLPSSSHDVRHGKCVACGRVGAELVMSCPGYKTAAEAGSHETQAGPVPKVEPKRVTTAVARPVEPVKPAPAPVKVKKSHTPAVTIAPIDDKLRNVIRAAYNKQADAGVGKCAAIRALASYPLEAVLQALPELSPSTIRIQHRSAQK